MTTTEHPRTSARFRRYVPWQGRATRVDMTLIGAILGVVALGLAIRPLTPFLLADHPVLLGFLSGDLVAIGAGAAFARIGEAPLWLVVVAGAVGMVKFDWLAWWAGRQWGAGIIRVFTTSEHAQGYAARATMATFLLLDLIGAVLMTALVAGLGYGLGQRAVDDDRCGTAGSGGEAADPAPPRRRRADLRRGLTGSHDRSRGPRRTARRPARRGDDGDVVQAADRCGPRRS